MSNRIPVRTSVLLIPILLITGGTVAAQVADTPAVKTVTPAPGQSQNLEQEKGERKPARRPPAGRVTVIPSQSPVAPQVVTVIHRLSGVKILRFLLRQSVQTG